MSLICLSNTHLKFYSSKFWGVSRKSDPKNQTFVTRFLLDFKRFESKLNSGQVNLQAEFVESIG